MSPSMGKNKGQLFLPSEKVDFFSKITGKPVCVKQISRATVPEYLQNDDKMQPREFHLHMRAADCAPESVVHIYDWFERATR